MSEISINRRVRSLPFLASVGHVHVMARAPLVTSRNQKGRK